MSDQQSGRRAEPPEIYPMPSFPMLAVGDVAASSRWYQDVLGFQDVFTMPGPGGHPVLAHLRWRKYADLLLTPTRGTLAGERGLGVTLCYACDEPVDGLAERARAGGARIVSEPGDRPWNARDFAVLDPDGYRLTFTGPLLSDPRRERAGSFDEAVARMQESLKRGE